jgi:hypothetical protein
MKGLEQILGLGVLFILGILILGYLVEAFVVPAEKRMFGFLERLWLWLRP